MEVAFGDFLIHAGSKCKSICSGWDKSSSSDFGSEEREVEGTPRLVELLDIRFGALISSYD